MRQALGRAVRSGVALQVGGVVAAFVALAAIPPDHGRMLILPVLPGSGDRLPQIAVATGARLMGVGPVPGSLVVWGARVRLAGRVFHAGALLLAAPPSACGEALDTAR